jgi:hypothetical protein
MTELMFSILFFIVVSAICVQCFAGSYVKSREAEEMTEAINLASNAAEDYLVSDDYTGFTDYYDSDWNISDGENGVYKVTSLVIEPEANHQCQSMHVVISTMDDEEIYSLEVEKALK